MNINRIKGKIGKNIQHYKIKQSTKRRVKNIEYI